MKRLLVLCCATVAALAMATTSARAQYYEHTHTTDNQLHTGFQLSGKINDRWSLNWGEELYFGNNMGQFQKLYSRLMVNYHLRPNLTLSPMVMYIANTISGDRTMIYDMNLIYTHRIDRWAFTLRGGTRLQDLFYTERQFFGEVRANPEFQLRGHIGAKYRLGERFEPFANIETFLLLNPATDHKHDPKLYTVGYYLPRVRSNVGINYHFDAHSSVSLYWRYDHTQTKWLSYVLADAPFGIHSSSRTNNFVGLFYYYKF